MERSPAQSDTKKLRFSLSTSKFSPKMRSGGENLDDSNLGQGMRDILLMKCKQTIEELYLEIEEQKKARAVTDETVSRLERDAIDKDSIIRDLSHRNEKLLEETFELRSKVNSLEQKLADAEQQLSFLESQEHSNRQIQAKYDDVCTENDQMAMKINKLSVQLRNQENVAKEWDETLHSINSKIITLETERDDLQKEKEKLMEELKEIKIKCGESEKLSQLLQGKYEYSERLTAQLERENRIVEELRIENKELQLIIQNLKETSEKLAREVTQTIANQERDFINHLEKASRDMQKQHEENLLHIKREHGREIDRLESTVEELRVDMAKLNTEKAYIKEDFQFLSNKLNSKEKELEEVHESFNSRWEQGQREKFEEIQQLKSLIDEQSTLINSYERMVEKEKRESGDEIRRLESANRQLKLEIQELTANNTYLTNKLKECQEELTKIQEEMKNTFIYEEEKSLQMKEKINYLEHQLRDRDTQIDASKEEVRILKGELKLKKKELEDCQAVKKEYSDEIFRMRSTLTQTTCENEDLKDKNRDIDLILHRKIEQISEELQRERGRRAEAENLCDEYREKIRQLEAKYKQKEANYRNQIVKKEEIDQMRQQRRIETMKNNRGSHELSLRKAEIIDRLGRSPKLENSKSSVSMNGLLRSSNGSAERDPYQRNMRQKELLESRKKSTSRFDDPRGSISGRPQHNEFVDRFKNVISKLENRLEKISIELNQ